MLATTNTEFFKKLFDASLHGATIHGANVLAQVAATTALTKCDNWLNGFIQHLHEMRALGLDKINQINGFSCFAPQGCYLFFCNITQTGYSSSELTDLLLEKAKVYVVPGLPRWFGEGAEGHIRICFSTSAEILTEAIDRIKKNI
jgi:bifunctional pyridoxal-dependent enzyme with beta-cystathionase and maltose regulon repressor activities